jgi:hypothetical protein
MKGEYRMTKRNFDFYFDPETGTNVSSDFAPAISIDHVNRLNEGFKTLANALGITQLIPMPAGSIIKRWTKTVTKAASQVGEGEVIGLSKVTRTALDDLTLTLKKYRRLTTAEAIQKVGADIAIDEADEALVGEVRKEVKSAFFTLINGASTTQTGGATLQATLAALWGKIQTVFDDVDCTPVFFVNPIDVATYLGTASISTQTAFGFEYVENFLGLGKAFISPAVTAGTVFATAAENLNCAYIPQSGDLGDAFGLTFDESGMVGMTHMLEGDRASVQTLILSGVLFYPEDASKIVKSTIVTN